jgi:hypothetical protein
MVKKLPSLKKSRAFLAKIEKEMFKLRKKMNALRLHIKLLLAKKTKKQVCRASQNGDNNPI